jgi:hypothetical protein
MAGRSAPKPTVSPVTPRVNLLETMTTKQTVRGQYKINPDGSRSTVVGGQSGSVPYSYYGVIEGKVGDLKAFQGAIADIIEQGKYPLPFLVADLNYGMEWRGRDLLARGIDPSMTDKQRARLEDVQGLVEDGICGLEAATEMLMKIGLSTDQITAALT